MKIPDRCENYPQKLNQISEWVIRCGGELVKSSDWAVD